MNSKFRIAILLVIVAAEIAILFTLRNVGWEASVAKLSWLGSVAIASLPLLAIFVILFRGRHRISLSSLLITVALVAIFLAAVITPIQSAKRLRLGSIALTEIGGGIVTTSSYPNLNTERVNPLPVWLRPLSSDTIACPCDAASPNIRINLKASSWVTCNSMKHCLIKCHGLLHISAIARLKQLNGLTIQGYDTGDQNITQFGESKSLAQINFVDSIVSGASVDALDSAMPNCVVSLLISQACNPTAPTRYTPLLLLSGFLSCSDSEVASLRQQRSKK